MINESYDPANIALIAALANGEGGGGGGGGDVDLKDVNYFDCFGNVLFAYTAAEYANLTAHPAGSNIEGKGVPLTFDSWNYTFSNAKTYVSKYGKLNIGGTYHPTDNKTHFFLDIKSAAYSDIDIRFTVPSGKTVTVDWGDGNTQTISQGSFTSKHNYNDSGVFEITIDGAITLSSTLLPDTTQAKYLTDALLCNITSLGNTFTYCSSLTSISIPDGVTSVTAFQYCISLKSVTIPAGVTTVGSFQYCSSLGTIVLPESATNAGSYAYCGYLRTITIPQGITAIDTSVFQFCTSLKSVTIPDSVTSIGMYAFNTCASIVSMTIPAGVTSINARAFSGALNIVYVDFSAATAVPTLGGTNAFESSLKAIIVPDGLYDSWIATSPWSSLASKIVKASEYIKPF